MYQNILSFNIDVRWKNYCISITKHSMEHNAFALMTNDFFKFSHFSRHLNRIWCIIIFLVLMLEGRFIAYLSLNIEYKAVSNDIVPIAENFIVLVHEQTVV